MYYYWVLVLMQGQSARQCHIFRVTEKSFDFYYNSSNYQLLQQHLNCHKDRPILLLPFPLETNPLALQFMSFGERIYCHSLQAILNFMESDLKVPQSPLSTHRSDSDSSSIADRSPLRHTQPRFSRSGSRSRSRSREQVRQEVPSGFFVKRNEHPNLSPRPQNDPAQGRFVRMTAQTSKREPTPVKSRRGGPTVGEGGLYEGTERELEWIKLERRCQLTEAENLKLQKINKSLQSQLTELEERVTAAEQERNFFKERLKSYEQKEGKPKERTNNLLKLKQEISRQKNIDNILPSDQLKQQLQTAQTQLQFLRDSLQRSETLRRQAQKVAQVHRSERQRFLQQLVQQLRAEVSQRGEVVERMKIQVNVLRVRQAKQEDQAQHQRNEELQAVKRKYGNVLKKYHQASTQLAAYRRKEERGHCWMDRKERNADDSLSFSP